jgi:hypothetical protein
VLFLNAVKALDSAGGVILSVACLTSCNSIFTPPGSSIDLNTDAIQGSSESASKIIVGVSRTNLGQA